MKQKTKADVFEVLTEKGFDVNGFTAEYAKEWIELFFDHVGDMNVAINMAYLAVRDTANKGFKTSYAVKKTVETWIAFDLKTVEDITEFVKKQDDGGEVKKPTWTTGKIPVPSEEERREAKAYLAELIEQGIVKA